MAFFGPNPLILNKQISPNLFTSTSKHQTLPLQNLFRHTSKSNTNPPALQATARSFGRSLNWPHFVDAEIMGAKQIGKVIAEEFIAKDVFHRKLIHIVLGFFWWFLLAWLIFDEASGKSQQTITSNLWFVVGSLLEIFFPKPTRV